VRALISIAKDNDYQFSLLEEVENINSQMKRDIVKKARKLLGDLSGKKIGILGLAFKANTDDMRDAPSVDIVSILLNDGAEVVAYDPESMENSKKILPDISYLDNPYDVAKDSDLIIIITDWNEFKELDLGKIKASMKSPFLIDARNIYDPASVRELGFTYLGVGR
jgi:UDPglucose 6-dehydrogenase